MNASGLRAAVVAGAVAVLVYLPALGNGFALDDGPIVERNPAAHSVGAALRAFDAPYWPPAHRAGQYRPLVVLSFAIDWELSGGSKLWLHAGNALWHGVATALLVGVLLGYVPLGAALAGGVFFATHPVHVEAVANLVGRAELMTAVFLFAATLFGRAVRRCRATGAPTWTSEAALLLAVSAALLSKEHAAVAVALLGLDEWGRRRGGAEDAALPRRDYVAVLLLTVLWLVVRRRIEAGLSFEAVAPTFFGLDAFGRVGTMLPVVFVLVRLLVWPFDLSPDYHPRVVERLAAPSWLGLCGLVLLVAIAALAALTWRRHRPASVGLWLAGIAWIPTANLAFPTGIVIAERTLYLASAGSALVFAYLLVIGGRTWRRTAAAGAMLVAVAFAWRSARQAPVWAGNRDLVLYALERHPESYRVHEAAARVFVRMGDLRAALREYGVAAELYPLERYLLTEAGSAALDAGQRRLALRYLRRSDSLDTHSALTHQLLARALLETGAHAEAMAHARTALRLAPGSSQAVRMVAASWVAVGEGDSAIAAWRGFLGRGGDRFEGRLLLASTYAALGRASDARAALRGAAARLPGDSLSLARFREVGALVRASRPSP